MVSIGMGIDNSFYRPVLLCGNFNDFLGGFFVVATVDQLNICLILPIDADFRRRIYVVAFFANLLKFVHGCSL